MHRNICYRAKFIKKRQKAIFYGSKCTLDEVEDDNLCYNIMGRENMLETEWEHRAYIEDEILMKQKIQVCSINGFLW